MLKGDAYSIFGVPFHEPWWVFTLKDVQVLPAPAGVDDVEEQELLVSGTDKAVECLGCHCPRSSKWSITCVADLGSGGPDHPIFWCF